MDVVSIPISGQPWILNFMEQHPYTHIWGDNIRASTVKRIAHYNRYLVPFHAKMTYEVEPRHHSFSIEFEHESYYNWFRMVWS